MTELRYALMAAPSSQSGWTDRARWAEDNGFDTLQLPDSTRVASPFPALAAAAAVTTSIRLRPWVLSAPFRTPGAVVREVAAVQQLSTGRFELGIGIGRVGGDQEATQLGMPWGSATRRRALLREVVDAVRGAVDPAPPIVVTAGGARMVAEAVGFADRIGLALMPSASAEDLEELAGQIRALRSLPLTWQVNGIGERSMNWRAPGEAGPPLGTAGILPADPGAAAALIGQRRELGIDELVIPDQLVEEFLPIMKRLG